MMKYRSQESAAFEELAREHFRELFRAAHALTGNMELAELTLGGALLTAYLHRHEWQGRVGNREGLMRAVRSVAALEMQSADRVEYPDDWNGLAQLTPEETRHPHMAEYLASQSVTSRRAVTLRYGCHLDARRIARFAGLDEGECLDALRGAQRAAERYSGQSRKQSARAAQRLLVQTVRDDMARPGDDLPDIGLIMREVERDAAGREDRRGTVWRSASVLLAILGVAACAALFWLLAILLESPIRGPARPQTSAMPIITEAPSDVVSGEERVYKFIRGVAYDSAGEIGTHISGRRT